MKQGTVPMADENLILRAEVQALLARDPDGDVVGMAGDHGEFVTRRQRLHHRVALTDTRILPTFQDEDTRLRVRRHVLRAEQP